MVTRIQSTSSSDEDYQQAVETSHFIFLVTITPYIVRLTIIHFIISCFLTLSLPESIMETCGVVLTFESVDKILCCDHVNETLFSSTFAWYHLFFSILQSEIWNFLEF